MRGGFVEDDFPIIRNNPSLRAGGNLWGVFGQNYWHALGRDGLYRPLTVFSFGLDRLVWGEEATSGAPSPAGIHRTNLLLHVVATLLVRGVLKTRLSSGAAAWLGAALFAVHPVHTEAVVHLVGRAELLMAVFFLAAVYLHALNTATALGAGDGSDGGDAPCSLRPVPGRDRRAPPSTRAGAAFCYLAALLSKESGTALLAVLIADALLRRGGARPIAFVRQQLLALWPYALALGAYVLARGLVLGATLDPPRRFVLYIPGQFVAFSSPAPGEVAFTMIHAAAEYLLLLVAPFRLSADYSGFPHHLEVTPAVVLAAGTLLALAALAILALRRGESGPAYWYAWFLLTLLPVSNLIAISGVIMAERLLYLPSVAMCAMGGRGLAALGARHWLVGGVAVVAVVGGLALVTYRRAPIWNDPVVLFEDTVRHGRYHGHIALTGLAGEYARIIGTDPERERDLLAPALEAATRSVAASPNVQNLSHLAFLLERARRLEEALESWEHLRRSFPQHPAYRSEVSRLLDAVLAQPERRGDLARVIAIGGLSLDIGERSGDRSGVVWWTEALARLLDAWIATGEPSHPSEHGHLLGAVAVAERCRELARRNENTALAEQFESIRTRLLAQSSESSRNLSE
jgi:hypothetical protein